MFSNTAPSTMMGGSATSVVRASELDAIRRRAFIGKLVVQEEAEADAAKRSHLKELSQARSKRWPNTLEAQRRAKAEVRRIREEREEAERRVLDREEEQRRAADRLATIKAANEKLQAQTDRMKVVQSQRLLSEVLDVRTRQIELKHRKAAIVAEQESEYFELQQQQWREADLKERKAAAAVKNKAHVLAKQQKEQLQDYTEQYILRLTQEREEGELIAQRAREAVEQERLEEERRRRIAKDNNVQMSIANDELRQLRDLERQKELEQERRIEAYALEKEQDKARKEAFIARKKAAAEEKRRQMREIMERDFLARQNNEERRLESQVAEKLAADNAEAARREERRRKQQAAIDRSRAQQVERKARERDQEAQTQAQLIAAWSQVQQQIEQEEREEQVARKAASMEHRAFLERQAAEKAARAAEDAELERRAAEASLEAAAADDAAFNETVHQVIADETMRGHNARGVARSLHRVQVESLQAANAMF